MPQTISKTFTYQTRLQLNSEQEEIFRAFADAMSRIERKLFADIASGKDANKLKSSYLVRFGITARQFNAVRVVVEGKIASIKNRRAALIKESKERITHLEKKIQKLAKRKSNPHTIHQKKRRLQQLKVKLEKQIADQKEDKIRICFGSRKLFRAQFDFDANGYHSHKEWKEEWQQARTNSFFLLGSKDETCGNQTCKAQVEADGSFTLTIRLPRSFEAKYGKYVKISNVKFEYGHDVLEARLRYCQEKNLEHRAAISYRFLKDKKGWRLFASTDFQAPELVTSGKFGAIGVDINVNHLAVMEVDRFGNPIRHKVFPLVFYGKSQNQSKALIGDVVGDLVQWARDAKKPLVVEKLDFQKKKTSLREMAPACRSRMLSSFAYHAIIESIRSCAFRFGVAAEEVNPAFTSLIGRIKFAARYGLSIHKSAALCIARRYLGASERLPSHLDKVPDGKGSHVAFSLPVRNREKHVWHFFRQVAKKLRTVLVAHFQAKKRSSNRLPSISCDRLVPPGFCWCDSHTRESSIALLD